MDNLKLVLKGKENSEQKTLIQVKDVTIGQDFLTIAGPCSVESKEQIVEIAKHVKKAGANPCPPIVVGVGIGGTADKCACLAKKALTRNLNEKNPDPYYAELEDELLEKINSLDIGPQGFGGKTTALKVSIETFATHIAGLPCCVNINCHVTRHKDVII